MIKISSSMFNFLKKNISLKTKDLELKDRDGRTVFINAVVEGDNKKVKILIEKNIDLNVQDKNGFSALHFAAQEYQLDIVNLLLEEKVLVDLQDKHGNTPLNNAVFYSRGRGEIIRSLLRNGADRNIKNNSGVSPLDLANTISNYDIKQFFI